MFEKIRETIHPDYHLEREKKNWLVSGADKKIQFKAPNRRSVGFSLEHKEQLALNIFSDNSPRDILKICDAMIAIEGNDKLYLFSLELKSQHKSYADKQLANGRHFWSWLMALYKEHGLLAKQHISYISILVWQPRLQARKGTTTHTVHDWLKPKLAAKTGFDACFEVQNRDQVPLQAIMQHLN